MKRQGINFDKHLLTEKYYNICYYNKPDEATYKCLKIVFKKGCFPQNSQKLHLLSISFLDHGFGSRETQRHRKHYATLKSSALTALQKRFSTTKQYIFVNILFILSSF